jgi:hypothetical protein
MMGTSPRKEVRHWPAPCDRQITRGFSAHSVGQNTQTSEPIAFSRWRRRVAAFGRRGFVRIAGSQSQVSIIVGRFGFGFAQSKPIARNAYQPSEARILTTVKYYLDNRIVSVRKCGSPPKGSPRSMRAQHKSGGNLNG